jgi:hypothetical protein
MERERKERNWFAYCCWTSRSRLGLFFPTGGGGGGERERERERSEKQALKWISSWGRGKK